MKLYLTWIYFIFFTLQDGNTSLVHAETRIFKEKEGSNITVGCPFSLYGSRRLLCKQTCDNGNILIETTKNTAQRGRYSVEYKEGVFLSQKSILYVTITQLEKSDSGLYRGSLGRLGVKFLDLNYDFQILVTNASTFSSSASTPATTVSSTVSSSSNETLSFSLYLVIRVTVVVLVLLLPAVLLLICKKKAEGFNDLNGRRKTDHNQTELAANEKSARVSTPEDSTYQSLNPVNRDMEQTYSTLTPTQ